MLLYRFDMAKAWAKAPANSHMATAVLEVHLKRGGRNENNILQVCEGSRSSSIGSVVYLELCFVDARSEVKLRLLNDCLHMTTKCGIGRLKLRGYQPKSCLNTKF